MPQQLELKKTAALFNIKKSENRQPLREENTMIENRKKSVTWKNIKHKNPGAMYFKY